MQFRVLGPMQVERDGALVDVGSPRQRSLLALLLIRRGEVIDADRLANELWDEAPPRTARHTLQNHVHRLRRALATEAVRLETKAAGYRLRCSPDEFDVEVFVELAKRGRDALARHAVTDAVRMLGDGLGLWRGRLLADVVDLAAFAPERVRLEGLRLHTLEDWFEARMLAAQEGLAEELEALVTIHPFRERLWRLLMLDLYRAGRQAEALDAFRRARQVLVDGLGVEPSPPLAHLQKRILGQDPTLERVAASVAPHERSGRRRSPSDADGPAPRERSRAVRTIATGAHGVTGMRDLPHLLERDMQFAELEHLLTVVSTSGQGRIAVVHGEAGIGKSALVGRFCREIASDARVLWGSCDALFTPRPLGPLRDVADTVGGALQAAVRAGVPPYEVAAELFAQLRAVPLTVLVLEDLHWADEATLDVVRLLARRVATLPVFLVVTYRDDGDVGVLLGRVLGELATLPGTTRVGVGPLSPSAITDLAAPYGRDGAQIHAVTGGNPLFAIEVLASPGADVPATVRQAVLGRVESLDPRARAVLDAIAIAPPRVDLRLLHAIAATDLAELDTCIASGLVLEEADSVAFRHELTRRAVAAAIPMHRGTVLHRRALDALAAMPEDRRDLPRLAHHADAAGDIDAVLRFGRAAAEQAADVGAFRQAAAHYARVLRHADRIEPVTRAALLERHAQSCYRTDANADAIAAMEQALGLARRQGDRRREGGALLALSQFLWCPGRTDAAMTHAKLAVSVLEKLPVGPPLGMAFSAVGQLALNAEHAEDAVAWSNRALAVADAVDDPRIYVHARTNLATVAGLVGDPSAAEQFDRCVTSAVAAGLDEEATRALLNQAVCAIHRHDYDTGVDALARAENHSRDAGHELMLFYVRAYQAVAALDLGDWQRAAELADLVVRYPRSSTIPRIVALTVTALLAARTGDGDPVSSLDEAQALATASGELERLVPPALARAELAWLGGRPEEIIDATEMALRLATERHATWMIGPLAGWRSRAGAGVDLPVGVTVPYLLQADGRHAEAAQWWSASGCEYAAALALLDAGDDASTTRAHETLRQLGAHAVADRVGPGLGQ